jgi:hypothetical protein
MQEWSSSTCSFLKSLVSYKIRAKAFKGFIFCTRRQLFPSSLLREPLFIISKMQIPYYFEIQIAACLFLILGYFCVKLYRPKNTPLPYRLVFHCRRRGGEIPSATVRQWQEERSFLARFSIVATVGVRCLPRRSTSEVLHNRPQVTGGAFPSCLFSIVVAVEVKCPPRPSVSEMPSATVKKVEEG